MEGIQIKRGEVYYARLDPVVGRETGKTRPVLIVQNDIGNEYSPTTIVAILTEYSERRASPPPSRGREYYLPTQFEKEPKRLITPRIATLSGGTMEKVDEALRNSLAL